MFADYFHFYFLCHFCFATATGNDIGKRNDKGHGKSPN